jgi:uncharacterized protein (DUF3084 family)
MAEQVKTLRRGKTKQEKLRREKTKQEKEKTRLEEESKDLKQRILRLVEQNQRLKGQLRDIHSSKSWQLLSILNRIRAQLLRK